MERLTVKRKDGRWALANNDNSKPMEQMEKIPVAIDRLAAYEDTGLEPEEINTIIDGAIKEFSEYDEAAPKHHLIELAQAEKDGRLVVLPCKPGQMIWVESCIRGRGTSIEAPDITWIIENIERFGREIFLSREEVEAALEKREDADNETD